MTVWVLLTHDVDWPKHGPGLKHVLARRGRFSPEVIEAAVKKGLNPYYGIWRVAELEEGFGFRSTFFFRPRYDDGTGVECYEDDIKDLVRGGWEIGVHLNSVASAEDVATQVRAVESLLPPGTHVVGCRVHYLRIGVSDYWKLREAGLEYDSSLKAFKDRVSEEDMGFRVIDGVVVFPITIMDAYLFTYMHVSEDRVVSVVEEALRRAESLPSKPKIVTILWHDSAVNMVGGRAYGKVLEHLHRRDGVKVLRCVNALDRVRGVLRA